VRAGLHNAPSRIDAVPLRHLQIHQHNVRLQGLRQGDEVVTAGQLKLREGAPVRAMGEAAQAAAAGAKPPAGDRPAAASSGDSTEAARTGSR